jgi:hypothetical protein
LDGGFTLNTMNLSSIITGVPDYIEFGWVCAPNATQQSFAANTITTLTLDTEISDAAALVSAPSSNQFTLPSGTYYFEASAMIGGDAAAGTSIIGLYNVTDSAWVSRCKYAWSNYAFPPTPPTCSGQLVIAESKTFDVRAVSSVAAVNGRGAANITDFSTVTNGAAADQRTTMKLWKLK